MKNSASGKDVSLMIEVQHLSDAVKLSEAQFLSVVCSPWSVVFSGFRVQGSGFRVQGYRLPSSELLLKSYVYNTRHLHSSFR